MLSLLPLLFQPPLPPPPPPPSRLWMHRCRHSRPLKHPRRCLRKRAGAHPGRMYRDFLVDGFQVTYRYLSLSDAPFRFFLADASMSYYRKSSINVFTTEGEGGRGEGAWGPVIVAALATSSTKMIDGPSCGTPRSSINLLSHS